MTVAAVGKRYIVGLAGASAAGKTTWCQIIAALYPVLYGEHCGTLSMDAYHRTNAELDALGLRKFKVTITTTSPLRDDVRSSPQGSPPSFNPADFSRDLHRVKLDRSGPLSLPVYDRNAHEPIADALTMAPEISVVFVDGLYREWKCNHAQHNSGHIAVLYRDGDWGLLHDVFDLGVYLHVDKAVSMAHSTARKAASNHISSEFALALLSHVAHAVSLLQSKRHRHTTTWSTGRTTRSSRRPRARPSARCRLTPRTPSQRSNGPPAGPEPQHDGFEQYCLTENGSVFAYSPLRHF